MSRKDELQSQCPALKKLLEQVILDVTENEISRTCWHTHTLVNRR